MISFHCDMVPYVDTEFDKQDESTRIAQALTILYT